MLPAFAAAAIFLIALRTFNAQVSEQAKQIHDRAIVIDSHADTTQRLLFDKTFDIVARNKDGNVDFPRMREGGLDVTAASALHAHDRPQLNVKNPAFPQLFEKFPDRQHRHTLVGDTFPRFCGNDNFPDQLRFL